MNETMTRKCYVIVCSCNGQNLKTYDNLDYYREIGRKYKQCKKPLFNLNYKTK